MRREAAAFLWDVQSAATAIAEFTRGKSLEEYLGDRMLQAAVERQSHNVAESKSLAALRDALLPKLISGELRVDSARPVSPDVNR